MNIVMIIEIPEKDMLDEKKKQANTQLNVQCSNKVESGIR